MKAKESGKIEVYGYCLMDNHVHILHILIKENEKLATSIKGMVVRYASWNSNKSERKSHLYQNRYKSELVETEGYLIKVLINIH